MQIEMMKTSELVPYAKNAKLHSDSQVAAIAGSIREFSFNNPVLIDKDNGIIAGHGRVLAAQLLKMGEVPCIRLSHLTDTQRRAYILADNRLQETGGGWNEDMLKIELGELQTLDFDLSLTGFDGEFVSSLNGGTEGLTDPDDVPEPPEVPTAKLGDIWQLGNHRLMCGDSTSKEQVERLMDGQKADMVFTDPPYNVKYTGGIQFKNGRAATNSREMIINDDIDIYPQVLKILSDFCNGACYIWFADTKAARLYASAEQYGEIHALIIWVKNGGYSALNASYKQKHEPCLFWKPKGKTLDFIGATTETTIWEIDKDGKNKLHPTQKPVGLAFKAISNHSAKSVLDLFGGSGSTLIACEKTARKCYMMELDPKYCDVIIRRWEDFTGKKAELVSK
jgi:DNA modification methylase